MTRVRSQLVALGLLLLLSVFLAAAAQAADGIVLIAPDWGWLEPHDAAYDADGNIVISGLAWSDMSSLYGYMFGTMRVLPDGNLDSNFGAGGIGLTRVGRWGRDGAWACAVQPDGKVISAGYSDSTKGHDFCLLRYKPDGSLDGSFNRKGVVTTDFRENDIVADIALQGDGKIVATGSSYDGSSVPRDSFLTARYTPSGQLDTTFGQAGYVRTVFPEPFGGIWGTPLLDLRVLVCTHEEGEVQVDDGILLVGNVYDSNSEPGRCLALVRYTLRGSLDTSFDEDGISISNLPGYIESFANTAIIDSRGRILVGGSASWSDESGGHSDLTVACFTSDGSLDTTFGEDDGTGNGCGFAFLNLHSFQSAKALAVQKIDGEDKIVAAGWNDKGQILVARFNADGTLDPTFNPSEDHYGYNETAIPDGGGYAVSVGVEPDNKILVVANVNKAGQRCTALLRYNSDGTLDTSFGGSTPPPTPGITVTPTSGLVTTESGGPASFSVVLDTQPTDDVTISVSSSNTAEGTVSVPALTFKPDNWNTAQTVIVTGVDDFFRDGDVAYSVILAPANSDDQSYWGLDPADVSVVNKDNEKGKPKP